MNEPDLINKIRNAVFEHHGVRLSQDDPIFTVILANKLMLNDAGGAIRETVNDLPQAITSAIEKIVLAVEDSEKTVGSLRIETKSMLAALAKMEVEEAHRRIRDIVAADASTALSQSTKSLQGLIQNAEHKIKELNAGIRESKVFVANTLLSVTLTMVTLTACVGIYMLNAHANEQRESANLWFAENQKLERAVENLPPAYKKQVQDALKSK